ALAAVLAESAGAAGAAPATAAVPAAEPLGAHVLLVEDEAVNAAVAQGYLTALGCTSVWVKDGAEAVARNAAERFDLILMDLRMPVMDGFATPALIRQRGDSAESVPIVELSAVCCAQSLAQLARALESSARAAAAAVCHKLASSAANVGAGAFARDVRQLERLCKAGDTPAARELSQRLAAAHPALIAELSAMRLRASA